uniref:PID domain-containing protein n=1 Tax=Callorhinchus milii TaxID=7868 RepID=A0A4W3H3J6_CALMI
MAVCGTLLCANRLQEPLPLFQWSALVVCFSQTVLMAHALRRILYTTCCPSDCQFAFVTRNPFRPPSELYCHLFVTRQPNEATLLNLQLCRLFQVEYCLQHRRERQSPSSAPCCPEQQKLDVSLNVNALVSFRLSRRDGLESLEPLGPSSEKDPSDKPGAECPFSSLTLVRKKAIRNKGIRSGAYRNSTFKRQFQQAIEDGSEYGAQSHGVGVNSMKLFETSY